MRNVFYRGWTNWLRGGLGAAFDASASPYLTAYPGQAWPVDSTVAMASLRLHDTLLPARFGAPSSGGFARYASGWILVPDCSPTGAIPTPANRSKVPGAAPRASSTAS